MPRQRTYRHKRRSRAIGTGTPLSAGSTGISADWAAYTPPPTSSTGWWEPAAGPSVAGADIDGWGYGGGWAPLDPGESTGNWGVWGSGQDYYDAFPPILRTRRSRRLLLRAMDQWAARAATT
ncbi:hypothetical protein B0H11DRAFT_2225468 [Mycena galericulata]|nr:hypothetical protein B0H11DRAFT_2225468 [Mycena galericulata]